MSGSWQHLQLPNFVEQTGQEIQPHLEQYLPHRALTVLLIYPLLTGWGLPPSGGVCRRDEDERAMRFECDCERR
jgi:hypothetical protein